MEDTELITFAQVERLKGHKRSTLTAAARTGKLKAQLDQTPIGPVWLTTLRDVATWEHARKRGRPPQKS